MNLANLWQKERKQRRDCPLNETPVFDELTTAKVEPVMGIDH